MKEPLMNSQNDIEHEHYHPKNINQDSKKAFLPGHHVFGRKSALYFVCDKSRNNIDTLAIEAADYVSLKKYNWNEKIRVQLTQNELPIVTAVFCGLLPECEYKNHGT